MAPIPDLARAADAFLVKRGQGKSIIAGYHWFDDWGRDAMISLPGLLLCTGRFEDARLVLKSFAAAMKDGVLPNDLGARSYNTVDASLWFVRAVGSYFEYSKDLEFVRELWPRLLEVFQSLFSAWRGLRGGRRWSYRIRASAHLDGCSPGWPAGDTAGRKMLRDKCPLVFCLERYAEALRGFRQIPGSRICRAGREGKAELPEVLE